MDQKEVYQAYLKEVDESLHNCSRQMSTYAWWHNTLQVVILLGSISLPFLLQISSIPKWVVTTISILVAVAAGLDKFYDFGDKSRIYHTTYELLRQEKRRYDYATGPYANLAEDKRFDLLKKQTEAHLTNLSKQLVRSYSGHRAARKKHKNISDAFKLTQQNSAEMGQKSGIILSTKKDKP